MEISARNQLPGTVTRVVLGTVMAEVEVEIDAASVAAAITRSSVDRLDIKEGDRVKVVIKATEIMIAK
jgi:molybdopterin-binding protein